MVIWYIGENLCLCLWRGKSDIVKLIEVYLLFQTVTTLLSVNCNKGTGPPI